MLHASPHEWYAPVDADDCLEPEHIDTMSHARQGASMVAPNVLCGHASGSCEHRGGAQGRVYGSGEIVRRGRYHVGLFRRSLMLSVGGYAPQERIGQDTLLMRLLRLCYDTDFRTVQDEAYLKAPTYHRVRREGSLTMARMTKHRSPVRVKMQKRNLEAFRMCTKLKKPELIRAYRATLVDHRTRDALAEDILRLSERLGKAEAA